MANKELLSVISKKKQELEKETVNARQNIPEIENEKLLTNDELVGSNNELQIILSEYINKLDSLRNSFPIAMESIHEEHKEVKKHFDKFIQEKLEKINDTTYGSNRYSVPLHYIKEFERQKQKIEHMLIASDLLPKNFLVSYVSQYDSFLGELIKCLLRKKPELINDSQRELKFKDLVQFGSIEDAREFLLEKEVESLLRDSHSEQFKWLENKFSIQLTKDLSIWSSFIEITERRNLFVHNNGTVSRQYMKICSISSGDISIKNGDTLKVDSRYLANAYLVFYEIGFKLTQVLWRKLLPDEFEDADNSLIDTTYNLLAHKRYKLAQTLLDFACETLKKHHSDVNRRIMIINRALSYKLDNDEEKCKTILQKDDWSATKLNFQLAVAVLKNEDETVYKLMKEVGNNNTDLPEHVYLEWPLFEGYREKLEFQKVYKEIFGKELEFIGEFNQ